MNWLGQLCQKYIGEDDTVLDLGCGIMQATDDLKCKSILGCDIWHSYLAHIKHLHPTVRMGMDETWRFVDGSFDVVICLDVVEHLPKELALEVINECKRICRKHAIIFTPETFKDNKESINDAWGLSVNHLQEHKCLITKQELRNANYHLDMNGEEGLLGIYDR